MARVNIPITNITRTGVSLAAAGTAGNSVDNHEFVNDGNTILRVKNTDGASKTVTLRIARTVDGQAVTNRTVNVGATTGDVAMGPFPVVDYGSLMQVDLSAATGVTLYAYTLNG